MTEKLLELYEVIADRFYLGNEVFEVGNEKYEPVSLFGLLTLVLNGRELIFGEYGSGKTTSSERISALFLSLPLEFIQSSTIHGHPEQTEEKIKATLDLARLEKEGKEVVRWKLPPFSPVIIVDEINRLPVGKQNILLNEIDRNIWSYRGETLIFERNKSFFATINYQDAGATNLIPPLLDRFDIAVETGRLHPIRKRVVRRGVDDSILKDRRLSLEMVRYILENALTEKADELVKYIEECREKFREELEERFKNEGAKLSIPDSKEIENFQREIERVEFADDAELFLDYLSQEIYCQLSLKKDFSKCNGCHYANYICSDIYSISNRAERSLMRYAKAIAWMRDEQVTLEHVFAVLPYVLWHRSTVNDRLISRIRDYEKKTSDEFYAVYEAIDSIKKRWYEHRDYQIEAYQAIKSRDYRRVKEIAEKINHPFFRSLIE